MNPVLAFFAIPLVAGSALLRGFVLVYLWTWFVQRPFGLPAVTWFEAVGLATLVSFVCAFVPPHDKNYDFGYAVTYALVMTVFTFGVGWTVAFFGGLL